MQIFSDELLAMLKKEFSYFSELDRDITEHDAYEIQNLISHSIDETEEKIHTTKDYFSILRYKAIFEKRKEIYEKTIDDFSLYKRAAIGLIHGEFYEISPEEKIGDCIISKIRFLSFLADSSSCLVEIMIFEEKVQLSMDLAIREYVFLSPIQSFDDNADEKPLLSIVK